MAARVVLKARPARPGVVTVDARRDTWVLAPISEGDEEGEGECDGRRRGDTTHTRHDMARPWSLVCSPTAVAVDDDGDDSEPHVDSAAPPSAAPVVDSTSTDDALVLGPDYLRFLAAVECRSGGRLCQVMEGATVVADRAVSIAQEHEMASHVRYRAMVTHLDHPRTSTKHFELVGRRATEYALGRDRVDHASLYAEAVGRMYTRACVYYAGVSRAPFRRHSALPR